MKKIVKTYFTLDENDKKAIKKQMIDLSLTSALLARNLGVSNAYISSLLNGQRRLTEEIMEQFKMQGLYLKCLKKTKSNISDTKWQKLKEWVVRVNQVYMNDGFFDCAGAICEVIDKMQELEGEDE